MHAARAKAASAGPPVVRTIVPTAPARQLPVLVLARPAAAAAAQPVAPSLGGRERSLGARLQQAGDPQLDRRAAELGIARIELMGYDARRRLAEIRKGWPLCRHRQRDPDLLQVGHHVAGGPIFRDLAVNQPIFR